MNSVFPALFCIKKTTTNTWIAAQLTLENRSISQLEGRLRTQAESTFLREVGECLAQRVRALSQAS